MSDSEFELLNEEEKTAIRHVEMMVNDWQEHSCTSCPKFTRMMCRYYLLIEKMKKSGRWPEGLDT